MTKPNAFQQSIARARRKIHEANRLTGVMSRQVKDDRALAQANLELFLDELQAETGLDVSKKENWPTVMIYVEQFLHDQEERREAGEDAAAESCDEEGFPKDRGGF